MDGEVAVSNKLKLGDIEVFCQLVHVRMKEQKRLCIVYARRKIAARVAVSQQRDNSCL